MATFSQVAKGVRARKRVHLPLPGAYVNPATGAWEGSTDELDVRPLRSDEYTAVLAGARKYAIDHGVADPVPDDELYERGRVLHTLAITCIDRDSPVENPRPYFEGGVAQIDAADILTPEILAYLATQQELVQDEVNPLLKTLSPEEFVHVVGQIDEGNMDFFVNARPGMLWSFVRTLASRHVNAPMPKSPSSSGIEPR